MDKKDMEIEREKEFKDLFEELKKTKEGYKPSKLKLEEILTQMLNIVKEELDENSETKGLYANS